MLANASAEQALQVVELLREQTRDPRHPTEFLVGQPGYETDLLYLASLVALVIGDSGPVALDQLLRKSKSED